MSNESLQTIVVAALAIALVLQTAVLAGLALLITRIRKPLDELIVSAMKCSESLGTKRSASIQL